MSKSMEYFTLRVVIRGERGRSEVSNGNLQGELVLGELNLGGLVVLDLHGRLHTLGSG